MNTNSVNPWLVLDPLGHAITDIRSGLLSSAVENTELYCCSFKQHLVDSVNLIFVMLY